MSRRKRSTSAKSKGGHWLPKAVGIIFLLAGITLIFIGSRPLIKASGTADWPTVRGTIISSESKSSRVSHGSGKRSGSAHGIMVDYEYEVDGKSYSSDVVAFGADRFHDAKSASSVMQMYPEGKEVTVFYDPTDPDTSVLEAGIHKRALILPGGGLAFLLGGLFMYFLIPGDMEQQRKEALEKLRNS